MTAYGRSTINELPHNISWEKPHSNTRLSRRRTYIHTNIGASFVLFIFFARKQQYRHKHYHQALASSSIIIGFGGGAASVTGQTAWIRKAFTHTHHSGGIITESIIVSTLLASSPGSFPSWGAVGIEWREGKNGSHSVCLLILLASSSKAEVRGKGVVRLEKDGMTFLFPTFSSFPPTLRSVLIIPYFFSRCFPLISSF